MRLQSVVTQRWLISPLANGKSASRSTFLQAPISFFVGLVMLPRLPSGILRPHLLQVHLPLLVRIRHQDRLDHRDHTHHHHLDLLNRSMRHHRKQALSSRLSRTERAPPMDSLTSTARISAELELKRLVTTLLMWKGLRNSLTVAPSTGTAICLHGVPQVSASIKGQVYSSVL